MRMDDKQKNEEKSKRKNEKKIKKNAFGNWWVVGRIINVSDLGLDPEIKGQIKGPIQTRREMRS